MLFWLPTTPTIVVHGDLGVLMRCPIGSIPGKYLRTSASLTMETELLPGRSRSSKTLPARVGTPLTAKYDGLTQSSPTSGADVSIAGAGRPSTISTLLPCPRRNVVERATT